MKYKVGSYREFKEFTLAVARGKRKVNPNEPKIWFDSEETAQRNRHGKLETLRQAIDKGLADVKHNRLADVDGDKIMNEGRQRLRDLRRAERLAAISKHVQGGVPVFRGTRIPIHLIADLLSQGETVESLRKGYPRLTNEMIRLAPIYARAHAVEPKK